MINYFYELPEGKLLGDQSRYWAFYDFDFDVLPERHKFLHHKLMELSVRAWAENANGAALIKEGSNWDALKPINEADLTWIKLQSKTLEL